MSFTRHQSSGTRLLISNKIRGTRCELSPCFLRAGQTCTKPAPCLVTILLSTRKAKSETRLHYGTGSSANSTRLESSKSNRTSLTRVKTQIWRYYHNKHLSDQELHNWEWRCPKEACNVRKEEGTMSSISPIVWRAWTSNRRRKLSRRGRSTPMHQYNKACDCAKRWRSQCEWEEQVLQHQHHDM
jgi:hypothetical protein